MSAKISAMNMGPMATGSTPESKPLDPRDILTVEELSRRLKVKASWVYEKSRSRGQFAGEPLPVLRVGKYLRFDWRAVTEWLRNGGGQ
jgi:hypothetical protein